MACQAHLLPEVWVNQLIGDDSIEGFLEDFEHPDTSLALRLNQHLATTPGLDLSLYKRGDYIHLLPVGRRRGNEGVVCFDGQKFVDLDIGYLSEGTTPPEFLVVTEFPIQAWKGLNDCNNIVWADLSPYANTLSVVFLEPDFAVTTFQAHGKTYTLKFWLDSWKDRPTRLPELFYAVKAFIGNSCSSVTPYESQLEGWCEPDTLYARWNWFRRGFGYENQDSDVEVSDVEGEQLEYK